MNNLNKATNDLISNYNDKTTVNFVTVRDLDEIRKTENVPASFHDAVNDLITNYNEKSCVNFITVRDIDSYRQSSKTK